MKGEKRNESEPVEEQETKSEFTIGYIIIAIIILIVLVVFTKQDTFDVVLRQKIPKGFLKLVYRVNKVTFGKWVKYFCHDIHPDFESYKKARKLSVGTLFQMYAVLGDTKDGRHFTKKDIAEACNTTRRNLRESIMLSPREFGLSCEMYDDLRVYPPAVKNRIVKVYFGEEDVKENEIFPVSAVIGH
jgi:hypothetical protein